MTITIERSLIRIYNSYGDPAGVGFVIAPGKLLTCAHVVITALELPANTTKLPGDVIHFDLHLVVKTRTKEFEQLVMPASLCGISRMTLPYWRSFAIRI